MRKIRFGLVATVVLIGQLSAHAGSVWYVQSGADGDGSRATPFGSLAEAEDASLAGDEIRVLASETVLEGSIRLKSGQTLRGIDSPRLASTNAGSHDGDLVTLADDTVVRDIHIVDAVGHAIVGRNVSGTLITGNRIDDANSADATSVATGATAGLGVAAFPKAVIGFVHDLGAARPNIVASNQLVGQTRLGGSAIAIHARGRARAHLSIVDNKIGNLGGGFPRSGILIDAQDDARIEFDIEATSVSNASESSDGILSVAQHRSRIDGRIRGYEFEGGANQGLGSNGIEVVTYYGRSWLSPSEDIHAATSRVAIEESDITGSGGFGFVVWNIFGRPDATSVVDLGSGVLGSVGRNRIFGNGRELPFPGAVYVVHDVLEAPNNWWGTDATVVDGDVGQLAPSLAFICRGEDEQRRALTAATGGQDVWSNFCQGEDTSALTTRPALTADPRP